jgi:hypothetical protein
VNTPSDQVPERAESDLFVEIRQGLKLSGAVATAVQVPAVAWLAAGQSMLPALQLALFGAAALSLVFAGHLLLRRKLRPVTEPLRPLLVALAGVGAAGLVVVDYGALGSAPTWALGIFLLHVVTGYMRGSRPSRSTT